MLVADGPDVGEQLLLGLATGLFLILLAGRSSIPGSQIVCAMVIATAGELFLSLVWGLYSYRFAAIPYYVPIGHGVFYVLAAESALQETLRRHSAVITRVVLAGGTLYAVASLVTASDVWGLLWWGGAVLIITRSRSPLLMSTCVVYTVLLEWLGTWLGNWRWEGTVPVIGLTSANPPSGVGILYCLLDLFTILVCSARWFARLDRPLSFPRLQPLGTPAAEPGI